MARRGLVFCPKCGGIMMPLRGRRGGDGKVKLVCRNCGYTMETEDSSVLEAYRMKARVKKEQSTIITVKGDYLPPGASVVKGVRCPSCGYEEAYFWMIQTRSADEPMTRFYKCKRCGYTWREYA